MIGVVLSVGTQVRDESVLAIPSFLMYGRLCMSAKDERKVGVWRVPLEVNGTRTLEVVTCLHEWEVVSAGCLHDNTKRVCRGGCGRVVEDLVLTVAE